MEEQFKIGTHLFHKEPNMNYQLNRIYSLSGADIDEIRDVSKKISTLEDWIREFTQMAKKALSENKKRQAAAYFRAANFYLSAFDPRKNETYDAYISLVHEIYNNEFTNGTIKEKRVPFADGYLPVWHIEPANRNTAKNVAVLCLGFDAVKEELISIIDFFREADIELYIFEGPGQGEALAKYHLQMTHEWEKPVKVVLDHFNLDDVTLIGLSLGGYLAPRAAAFEPRVKRVIAWGVLYDFFETVISRRGKFFEILIKILLFFKASAVLNAIAGLKMKRDTYTRWGIEHGMHVLGANNPYEYFKKMRHYTTKDISHLINQDFLLISSTHCHFIPDEHFGKQARKLVNVKSFTARIFTKQEKAENHVSFSNVPLVIKYIINWIKQHTQQNA